MSNFKVIVYGNSMSDLLKSGDVVVAQPCHTYNFGDIIIFRYDDKFIIHRIILNLPFLKLQAGDNSNNFETFISKNIQGKAIYILDNKLTSLTSKRLNMKCAFVALVLMLFQHFFKTRREIYHKKIANRIFKCIIKIRNELQSEYYKNQC